MKNSAIPEWLLSDKIGVVPTDTIYGVAASALSKKAVARVYKILKRDKRKPFIILIASLADLELFGIDPENETEKFFREIWPGKISVVLPVASSKFQYLHRGTRSLAFRMPKRKPLLNILVKTGPLISTSANLEGKKPAETVAEAKRYFGATIDFYTNGGRMKSAPSTLIEIKGGKVHVLRKGSGRIPKILFTKLLTH